MEELKNKIELALQNDFIGDIIFTEEELAQMKQDCISFYRKSQLSWSKFYSHSEIAELLALIVNTAKDWDDESEGRFWTKLFGEIFDDGSISPNKFYDEFESCLARYGKTLFRSKENKRMFREVFLLHALAPDNSGASFIRLLWNWYSDPDVIDFDYQPEDSIYTQIANFLEHEFGGENDLDEAISFEGKTYAIKASFKYLFTQDKASGLKLLHRIFSAFDDIYFHGTYNENSYIDLCCNVVVDKILSETNKETVKKTKGKKEHIISDYSRIYATYEVLEDNMVAVVVPEIRAVEEIAEEYRIEVFNNDRCIFSSDRYIEGIGLKRKIKKIIIPFKSFNEKVDNRLNLRVVLSLYKNEEYELLYDSGNSLYRDFIVFKSTRENRSQTCKPGSYLIVHPYNVDLENFSSMVCNNLDAYTSTVNSVENDYISTENQSVFFNQQPQNSHVIICGDEIDNVSFYKDDISCPIYKKLQYIDIVLDKDASAESIFFTLDEERHYSLVSNSHETDMGRRINFQELGFGGKGLHCLLISDATKKKLLHRIDYYVVEKTYFNIEKGFVFDKNNINVDIVQLNDNNETSHILNTFSRVGQETISLKFDSGEIIVSLPYIKWKINNEEWNYGALRRDFWHSCDLLHNNCTIEIENHSGIEVDLLINDKSVSCNKNGIFLLGDALTDYSKNDYNMITLKIGDKIFNLFNVYNKEKLYDFDINIEDRMIDMSPYFIGESDAEFIVQLENDVNHYEFRCGLKSIFEPNIVDGEYDVKISLLDFWDNKVTLYSNYCIIGNPDKFCFDNKKIVLKSFKKREGGKIKLEGSTIVDLKYLREEKIGTVYSGILIDQKKKYNIEVYKKDDNSLTFYFVDGENLLSANYNLKGNKFTKDKIIDGDTTIIPCPSCYYNSEEIA